MKQAVEIGCSLGLPLLHICACSYLFCHILAFKVDLYYPPSDDNQNIPHSQRSLAEIEKPLVTHISIGSPWQNFTVAIDLQSDILVLPSTTCLPRFWRSSRKFNPGESHTLIPLDSPFVQGAISGELYSDVLYIEERFVGYVSLGLARYQTGQSVEIRGVDGSLGLLFAPKTAGFVHTLMEIVVSGRPVGYVNIFTVYFKSEPEHGAQNLPVAELFLGRVPFDDWIGPDIFIPLHETPTWGIHIQCLRFDGQEFAAGPIFADLSLTTQFIWLDRQYEAGILQVLGAGSWEDGMYYVACDRIANLPRLIFDIEDDSVYLTPNEYILKTRQEATTRCFSSFRFVAGTGHSRTILGSTFMKPFVTVFDKTSLSVWLKRR